eukprot:265487_1
MSKPCTPIESTVLIAIISVFLSIITLIIVSYSIIKFRRKSKESKATNNWMYFYRTSIITISCNIVCCIAVSIYSIWIIFSSTFELEEIITLRAVPTVFWFSGKVSLIWIWNGRLYYTFHGGLFETSYPFFIIINILIAVAAPSCIFLGYLGVYQGNTIMIVSGFQGFRILYILLTFILLFMW